MLAWWACKSGVPLPAIWKCNPWVVGSSWTKRYDIRYEPSRNVGVANKIPQVVFTLDDLPVHHKATQRQLLTHVHTWGRIRAGLDKSRLLGGSVPCFPGKHCLTHSGLSGSGVSRRSEQGYVGKRAWMLPSALIRDLESTVNLWSGFLDRGRKPEGPEKTNAFRRRTQFYTKNDQAGI